MTPEPDGPIGTRLIFEDESTRVWLVDLTPGEATEWHRHTCDYVTVVTSVGQVRCDYVDGSAEHQDSEALGSVEHRVPDDGHRLVNVGTTPYGNVIVELKHHSPPP